jgi:NAD(P)-dependent dehydrogenase (short-subunit alcohol dehydrogenase family)
MPTHNAPDGGTIGKVALVTGRASGIGRAAALLPAAEAPAGAVTDPDNARACGTAAQMTAAGGAASAHARDVSSKRRGE